MVVHFGFGISTILSIFINGKVRLGKIIIFEVDGGDSRVQKITPLEVNGAVSVLTLKEKKIEEKEGSLYLIFNWCVIKMFLLKIDLLFCYFFQFLFQGFQDLS
jgi:hypothetical protein